MRVLTKESVLITMLNIRLQAKKANDDTYDLNPVRLWSSNTQRAAATTTSAQTPLPRAA